MNVALSNARNHIQGLCLSTLLVAGAGLALAATTAGASDSAIASRPFAVESAGAGLVFRSNAPDLHIAVRVTGPNGFVFERASSAEGDSAVAFAPADLADGAYKYEVRGMPLVTRRRGPDEKIDAAPIASPHRVLSGGFTVSQGTISWPSDLPEPPGPKPKSASPARTASDFVTAGAPEPATTFTDSLCVGFDCPASPSFSDSTILLMENNTRIKFEDTSSAAGFPNNDWEIEANSNLSGGASYLGFNDCGNSSQGGCADDLVFAVESGARASALYVESDGDVGLGTSNPVLDLHIVTGNTPSVRLDQDGSSGFTPQVWDVAGNEANFFVRDVTSGSRLPFRIQPGAPTSSIYINNTGNVGIGTSSPSVPIHVLRAPGANPALNAQFALQNSNGAVPNSWFFMNQSTNGAFVVSPVLGGAAPLKIFPGAPQNSIVIGENTLGANPRVGIHRVAGVAHPLQVGTDATNGNGAHVTAAGVWTNGSSRKNKTDIRPLTAEEALAALAGLTPVHYRGKNSDDPEEYVGFIAEDVPDLVSQRDRESLSPMDIVAVLARVVQVERTKNEELEARLARLEAQLAATPQP